MTKFSRLKDWPIEQAPFLRMSKDAIMRRLLMEWTALDANQIQETVGAPFQEDADVDSDSDGGASTALGLSDKQWSSLKEQPVHQRLKHESDSGRTRDPGPRTLTNRFSTSMEKVTHAGPARHGFKGNTKNALEASSLSKDHDLESIRHTGQQSAPMWAPPGLTQGQQDSKQSRGSFHRLDPGPGQEMPHLKAPTLHAQAPAAARPLPEDWINFT